MPSVSPLICFGHTGPALSYHNRVLYASLAAADSLGNPRRNRSLMSGNAPAPCEMRQCRCGYLSSVLLYGGEEAVMEEMARAVSK